MKKEPLATWKGRRVRSVGDTPEGAATKVPAAPRPGSLFFVPSPMEGWGLDVLLERLAADSVVVVFEKDLELTQWCADDWAAFAERQDARLFRLDADTEEAIQRLFRLLPLATLRRCEFLTLNGAWLAHGPRYREVFARIEAGLTRWWSNRITCLHMGPLWIRNLLANVSEFRIEPWADWGDKPVVVCGAGVTLESALPWVQAHRHQLRIVAADTALPVLGAYDMVPDAVVCLEAQHANLRDFAGWTGANIDLYTDLTSFPPGTRVFAKPPKWFLTEFTDLNLWHRWPWGQDQIPRLPPLGSVGVAATWVSWRLTRGPVILAGLDFCYPPGKTHARGAPSLSAMASRTDRLTPMEQTGTWVRDGIHQTAAGWLTSPVMEGYAGVMADQARPHRERTWVWSTLGLPLGLPEWSQTQSLDSSATSAHSPPLAPQVPTGSQWLAGEQELWLTILDDFDRINGSPDEAAWSELETHLAMADYLTFSFPDPQFRRDSDWLIRAQAQVRWALNRVSRPRRS